MVSKNIITSGKRKESVARAVVKKGNGVIRINSINLDVYANELVRMKIKEPLIIAGEDIVNKVNVSVKVKGGGWNSQAESARLAIAKGLVEYTGSKKLKKKFLDYDRHLLVADIRRTESQKPYRSAARAKRQKSKR